MQDLPLPVLFRRADAAFQRLQNAPGSPADQKRLISDALACLDRASILVDSLGIFSSNEDKDDLATGDIKFLLIPYYQAEFLAQQQPGDKNPETRLSAIKSAQALLEIFLSRVRQYELVSAGADRILAGSLDSHGAAPKLDPTTLRQLKIEKFKLEKSVTARQEALEKLLKNGGGNEENGEAGTAGAGGDDLEAAEREASLLRIELAALKSAESLRSLRQEVEVLSHAANLSEEDRRSHRATSAAPPQDLLAELRKAAGALKLGSEASRREDIRNSVFHPSHILPTMTVEQQGDIEVAEMLARQRAEQQRAQKAAAAKAARGRAGDDSEDDDDNVYRQRAMDNWKDENPRGSGNSKLRPCG